MSEAWKKRQCATQDLVGLITDYLLRNGNITASELYGLCQLTWITKDFLDDDAGYIYSTKLPGLRNIFGESIPVDDLGAAAKVVATKLGNPRAAALVRGHTGITNFRNAYRNTSRIWLGKHKAKVVEILRRARALASDRDGSALAGGIAKLPGIPRTIGVQSGQRKAAGLLTPLAFSIDPRRRFPMINGNPGVMKLLKQHGVAGSSLVQQHDVMVAMIGRNGIRDAADLDLYGQDLLEIRAGKAMPLARKPTDGKDLKQKDDSDTEVIRKSATRVRKRLHNTLTNLVRDMYKDGFALTEGGSVAMYDIDVAKFDGENHLLIEVKSSTGEADVRMAIGQLYAYGFHLGRSADDCMAVLLPEAPSDEIRGLLDSLDIGLLWFSQHALVTETEWLEDFVAQARPASPHRNAARGSHGSARTGAAAARHWTSASTGNKRKGNRRA